MISVEGESRILVALGLGWFGRQRIRLWFYFLPKRLVCAVLGRHEWNEPHPSITCGPLHKPPAERDYYCLAVIQWCKRCHVHRDAEADTDAAIAEARAEDAEEWADPETRAAMEKLTP